MRLSVVEARSVASRHSISEFTLGETVFFTHDQVLITPPPPPITLGVPLSLIAPFPPNCCHTLRSFTMLFSVPGDERIFHGTAFEPTPEPTTLLLFGATAAGLGVLAPRRRKATAVP